MSRYGSAGTVKGDPHWIAARYLGECKCGAAIAKGARAWYWPHGRKIECEACGETSEQRFLAEVQDEFMSGGWS